MINSSFWAQNNFDFKQYKNEAGEYLNFPKRWTETDYLITAGILSGTFAVMNFDDEVRSEVLKSKNFDDIIPLEMGRIWGEPYTPLATGLFFLIQGNSTSNRANKKLGFEILQSFTYNIFTTQLLKMTIGRERPSSAKSNFEFTPFTIMDNEHWSLPSGHTSVAFAFSTTLAANTDKLGMKILYFTPAFVTAVSRVLYNRHWVSDVFLGAFIGYFTAKFVTDMHQKNEEGFLQEHNPLINITLMF